MVVDTNNLVTTSKGADDFGIGAGEGDETQEISPLSWIGRF